MEDIAGYGGFEEHPGRVVRRLEIPGPSPILVLNFDERLRVSAIGSNPAVTFVRSFLVSSDAAPVIVEHSGSLSCLEVELSPWTAISCFGPSDRLPGGVLPLEDLWPREARWLPERLAELPKWESRFALIDHVLVKKIAALKRGARPEIRWAWNEIKRLNGNVRIAQIARTVGCSSRHFASCFREQTGLTPKAAARRFRFHRARRLVSGAAPNLAAVALACGYSDQSHLTREFTDLAGCSPAAYHYARSRIFQALRRTWPAGTASHFSSRQRSHPFVTLLLRKIEVRSELSYIEFGAGDAGKARAFLVQLFGWDFHLMGTGPEGWFQTPSIKAGLHGNDPNPGILVFFGVPDLEEAIAKVKEMGGEADDPSEEPGFGRFCTCRDPQGIRFGLHRR